jgi:hypothetical protein
MPPIQSSKTLTEVSIVAVHGLGADPTYSWSTRVRKDWSSPDGTSEHGTPRAERDVNTHRKGDRVFWLRDKSFLPAVFPDATVMTFKHSADWIYRAPSSTAESSGRSLLEHLKERLKRNVSDVIMCNAQSVIILTSEQDAPIVLIGHSYGGLVIKAVRLKQAHHRARADVCDRQSPWPSGTTSFA